MENTKKNNTRRIINRNSNNRIIRHTNGAISKIPLQINQVEATILKKEFGMTDITLNNLIKNIRNGCENSIKNNTSFNIFDAMNITVDDNLTTLLNEVYTYAKNIPKNKKDYDTFLDTIAILKGQLFNLLFINEFTFENVTKIVDEDCYGIERYLETILPAKLFKSILNTIPPSGLLQSGGGQKGGTLKIFRILLIFAVLANVCLANMADRVNGLVAGYKNDNIMLAFAYGLSNDPFNVALGKFQGDMLRDPKLAKEFLSGALIFSVILFIGFAMYGCLQHITNSTSRKIHIINNSNHGY